MWIWMGYPALADPATIADLRFLSGVPDTGFNKGYVDGVGHYQLYVDNILDLSHTVYLHPATLGGGSITRTRAKVAERADGTIAIHWHVFDDVPTPLFGEFRHAGDASVDSWSEVEWSAPGVMRLVSGAVRAGGRREDGVDVDIVHILTPETAGSSRYFFASTRNFGSTTPR